MRSLIGFLLLLAVTLSHADQQVVGTAKCGDCKENNFKTSDAFSGLHVTIDCKLKTGQVKRMGVGEVDQVGSFKVSLPQEMIDGKTKTLKEECFAQLHSSAALPCPAQHGLEAHKIEFKPQSNTFGPKGDIQFSTALCTSKLLWPFFKYPPLSKDHWPKISFPPFKPLYKTNPLVKPPLPIYKPNPLPPHVPTYKPNPPVVKPPPPIYKHKPNPPVYKPKPPVYKPNPLPPPLKKPLPPPLPLYPIPPFYKKPCPPFPKIPNYFKHPKLAYFPPLPPSFPQP